MPWSNRSTHIERTVSGTSGGLGAQLFDRPALLAGGDQCRDDRLLSRIERVPAGADDRQPGHRPVELANLGQAIPPGQRRLPGVGYLAEIGVDRALSRPSKLRIPVPPLQSAP